MGCLRVCFGCVEQSFPDVIIKPYEGTSLTIVKVCCVQFLLEFPLIWLHGCKTDPELQTERLDIASFAVGSKSLWPHKVGSRGEIYSARLKLMLISDQAKDLVKNCLKAGTLCLLSNRWFKSGILNKSTV